MINYNIAIRIADIEEQRKGANETAYDDYIWKADIFTFLNIFGLFCSSFGVVASTAIGLVFNNMTLAYVSYWGLTFNIIFYVFITNIMNKREYNKIKTTFGDLLEKDALLAQKLLMGFKENKKLLKKLEYYKLLRCLKTLTLKIKIRDSNYLSILLNLENKVDEKNMEEVPLVFGETLDLIGRNIFLTIKPKRLRIISSFFD